MGTIASGVAGGGCASVVPGIATPAPTDGLVDRERRDAEFRVLGSDGRYRLAFSGSAGLYQSTVLPPLRLRIEWLWQEPGPDMDEVLRELGRPLPPR